MKNRQNHVQSSSHGEVCRTDRKLFNVFVGIGL